jgi:hypothetical protein
MIWEKLPSLAFRLRFQQKPTQSFKEILPIPVIPEDLSPLNPPDDMVKYSQSVQAS